MTSSENFEKCSVRKMIRYTRPIHRIHPSQRESYIISDETTVRYHKSQNGIVTVNGPAIDKLGQYEDIGTLQEVRMAMEHFKRKNSTCI